MGFTLIEMLVVIFIIGTLVATATLSFGVVGQREFRSQADRLLLILQHAADASLFQQKTYGLYVDTRLGQYQVMEYKLGSWKNSSEKLFATTELGSGSTLYLAQPKRLPTDDGDNTNGSDRQKKPPTPDIVFLNSGEYTPFQLLLKRPNHVAWVIEGDGLGRVALRQSSDGE
ncbi:type II secretion system minor pseudopilin GspH [bacterium SCSIO 12696]|nr:type II secretion system minor pseudopilin GspH [bacterium SCSIO 12696]